LIGITVPAVYKELEVDKQDGQAPMFDFNLDEIQNWPDLTFPFDPTLLFGLPVETQEQ
jgi:hypothetical protein